MSTLPASGNSISLNQMHVEVGGTSGTTCSLNDADIRSMILAGRDSGATSSFSNFFGLSGIIIEVSCSLSLNRSGIQVLTGYDAKGNPSYSVVGYKYELMPANWSSVSITSGYGNGQNYLHPGAASLTSLSNTNFFGALSSSAPYDMVGWTWTYNRYTSSGYTDSKYANIQYYKLNNAIYHLPNWDANATAPTGWNQIQINFTYSGTSYSWTYTRSTHAGALTKTQQIQSGVSFGGFNQALSDPGTDNFTGPGTGGGTIATITGATIKWT